MPCKWTSVALVLSVSYAGAALAQDNTNGAGTGGVAVQSLQPAATDQTGTGQTETPNTPIQAVPGDGPPSAADQPLAPNAPVQATPDEGPVPAGTEAGTTAASSWMVDPVVDAAIGVAVVGVAVCLAACGGGGSTTSTTTTTRK
jgi:hypothetical protein